MNSLPSPVLYQRLPAVTIPENASPTVVPIPILADPPPPPPPPAILISTVVPFTAKVLPEPIKLRVVKPNPMVPPEVLIPTPIPPPWNCEAVTIPEKDALPFVAMVAAVPALI